MHSVDIRDFRADDLCAVDALGVAAFEQFADAYEDWPGFRAKISGMSSLAATGEIIVATIGPQMAGAVAYLGPQSPKSAFFPADWAVMRMLVVAPNVRGHGIGKALASACLDRARRDQARTFGLHTSTIMTVALPMYLRMGFEFVREAPRIHGVAYGIYAKQL